MDRGLDLCFEGGGRDAPRRAPSFLCLAKEKKAKEGDPTACAPARAPGNLRCAVGGVRSWNSLRLRAPLGQSGERQRSVCVLRHTRHPAPCAPRRSREGGGSPHGPSLRSAASAGPSAAKARIASPPFLWLRRGAQGAGWRMCRRTHTLRCRARRGCPSGARQRAASSTAHPETAHRRLPEAKRQGRRQRGRLSFGFFSWRDKKSRSPAGARPGLHPWRKHHIPYPQQSTACTVPTAAQDDVCAKCPRDVKNKPNMPITLTG